MDKRERTNFVFIGIFIIFILIIFVFSDLTNTLMKRQTNPVEGLNNALKGIIEKTSCDCSEDVRSNMNPCYIDKEVRK